MVVNSLPKTVTRQRHGCDLNPGPTAPEFSTLTTRLLSYCLRKKFVVVTPITVHVDESNFISLNRFA